jgi:hypothetical protein
MVSTIQEHAMLAAPAAPPKIRFEGVGKTFEIRSGP